MISFSPVLNKEAGTYKVFWGVNLIVAADVEAIDQDEALPEVVRPQEGIASRSIERKREPVEGLVLGRKALFREFKFP